MVSQRVVLVAALVAAAALVAVPTDATPASADRVRPTAPDATTLAPNNSTSNASFGVEISSFMQNSAARASGSVSEGLWAAEYASTTNRSARATLIDRRTTELERTLADLQATKRRLIAAHRTGNISRVEYRARISNLIGRIASLRDAINATTVRAERADANVTTLRMLTDRTRNVSGRAVAAVARNVTSVESPGRGERGRPNHAASEGPGGRTTGPNGTNTTTAGGPASAGNESGNGGGTGPPDRVPADDATSNGGDWTGSQIPGARASSPG